MTAKQNVVLAERFFYGVNGKATDKRANQLLQQFELSDKKDRVEMLS